MRGLAVVLLGAVGLGACQSPTPPTAPTRESGRAPDTAPAPVLPVGAAIETLGIT